MIKTTRPMRKARQSYRTDSFFQRNCVAVLLFFPHFRCALEEPKAGGGLVGQDHIVVEKHAHGLIEPVRRHWRRYGDSPNADEV